MSDTLWKKAVSFHGHECGGIALGVRACMEAIDRLGITFSEDEDLVCDFGLHSGERESDLLWNGKDGV